MPPATAAADAPPTVKPLDSRDRRLTSTQRGFIGGTPWRKRPVPQADETPGFVFGRCKLYAACRTGKCGAHARLQPDKSPGVSLDLQDRKSTRLNSSHT